MTEERNQEVMENLYDNIVGRANTLREKIATIQEDAKKKVATFQAELKPLEALMRAKAKGEKKKRGKRSKIDFPEVIRKALESTGEAMTAGQIKDFAVENGLWDDPPKNAVLAMAKALKDLKTEAAWLDATKIGKSWEYKFEEEDL